MRLGNFVLPLCSPLVGLCLQGCGHVLGPPAQEGCGGSGCEPRKGQRRWSGAEARSWWEELREQGLFRSEAAGSGDPDAAQPPKMGGYREDGDAVLQGVWW